MFRQGLTENGKREIRAYLADIGVIRLTVGLEIGGSIITAGFQQFVQSGVFDIGTSGKGFGLIDQFLRIVYVDFHHQKLRVVGGVFQHQISFGAPCFKDRACVDGKRDHALIQQLLELKGLASVNEVDLVVCHQANARIIDFVSKKLGAREGLFYKNMDRYGNTSAASIPIALDELVQKGLLRPGMRVLMVGFGGGLTWAGALLRW